MNTAIEMTPADLAEADRANEIMRDANTAVEAAREACDAAALQDNIPDSIAADFARCAAKAQRKREQVLLALGKDIRTAEMRLNELAAIADDIDNQRVAADVRL